MSSGCGDVLSLADLQTAKKHQIFEAEVITGLQGGVAGGAAIDFATNLVTMQVQKTLPAVLRDAGFRPASFTFATGGTVGVGDADKAVLWPISGGGDGNYYVWKGALPKTIPAASSPSSTGGVSSSAWNPITDGALRTDLASNTGGTLVGLRKTGLMGNLATTAGAFYQSTVINLTTDYGVIGDFDPSTGVSNGTNNVAAMQAAVNAVIANGGNATMRFPSGRFRFKKLNDSNPGAVAVTLGTDGAGLKNVTIEGSGFSTEIYCDDIGRLFGVFAADNVVIRNMKVIGYGGGTPAITRERDQGFALGYNCKNVIFENMYIDNFYGDCIYLGGDLNNGAITGKQSQDVTIRNCILKERYGNGVRSYDPSGTGTRSRLAIAVIDVAGLYVHDNLIYGEIDLEPNSNGQNVQYFNISHNAFRSGGVSPVTNPYACEPLYTSSVVIRGGITTQSIAATTTSAAIIISNNLIEYGRIRLTGDMSRRTTIHNNRIRRGGIFLGHYSGTNFNVGMVVYNNQVDASFSGADDNMETWIVPGNIPSAAFFIQGSLTNCRIEGNFCGSVDAGFSNMFYLLNTTQTGGIDLAASGGRNVFQGNITYNTTALRNYALRPTDLDVVNVVMPSSGVGRTEITKQLARIITVPVVDITVVGSGQAIPFNTSPSNKYRITHATPASIGSINGYTEETGMRIQIRSTSATAGNTLTLVSSGGFYLKGGVNAVIDSTRYIIVMELIESGVWTEVSRNF